MLRCASTRCWLILLHCLCELLLLLVIVILNSARPVEKGHWLGPTKQLLHCLLVRTTMQHLWVLRLIIVGYDRSYLIVHTSTP